MVRTKGYFDFSDSEEDEKHQDSEKVPTRPSVYIQPRRHRAKLTFSAKRPPEHPRLPQLGLAQQSRQDIPVGPQFGLQSRQDIPVGPSSSAPVLDVGNLDHSTPPNATTLLDKINPKNDFDTYYNYFNGIDDSNRKHYSSINSLPSPSDPYYGVYRHSNTYGIDKQVQTPPDTAKKVVIKSAAAAADFIIVLIDLKKAAEERLIHCYRQHLERAPSYVALSYRWGELDEQMVPATKAYNARITSFQLEDFFKLCQAIHCEPTLKHIPYLWVDAICVDQTNMEKRKTTIYRMNDIFIHATAIVAVPDLHAHHLSITTTANSQVMETLQHYRRYLYYLLVGTPEAQQMLVEMDSAWMDDLGIPTMNLPRRDVILGTQQLQQQKKRGLKSTTTIHQDNSNHHQRGAAFFQNMMALFLTPPQSSTTTTTDRAIPTTPLQDQQLPYRMMVEFQRLEWQQKLDQRQADIHHSIQFLQSLMKDWSNRAWVISEYHIAKRKTGKLIFWFNQLSCPELAGLPFFEFNFVTKQRQQQQHQQQELMDRQMAQLHPFTYRIMVLTSAFQSSMRQRLTHRSVLEMMLQTKARKNEDKFHSIIPLATDYKHHIKDRDSIAALGISDMLSVRMVLMEWMHTKDTLILLYSECQRLPSTVPLLPTFATHLKDIKPALAPLLRRYSTACNFDIKDPYCVRLVRAGHKNNVLDELWLRPRACHGNSTAAAAIYKQQHDLTDAFWKNLGLDQQHQPLDVVTIPLFNNAISIQVNEDGEDQESIKELIMSTITLVGSWDKNIWVRTPISLEVSPGTLHDICIRLPHGFRIY